MCASESRGMIRHITKDSHKGSKEGHEAVLCKHKHEEGLVTFLRWAGKPPPKKKGSEGPVQERRESETFM